eukprot:11044973-Lingulodinium_polyedra.AAC.1
MLRGGQPRGDLDAAGRDGGCQCRGSGLRRHIDWRPSECRRDICWLGPPKVLLRPSLRPPSGKDILLQPVPP